jgi:tetratricopeptide (TPR) repeat protein
MLISTNLQAKGKSYVDHISLAALLIKDGHDDRALKTLKEVDLKNKDTDFKRFHTLRALAFMHLKNYEAAIKSFKLALKAGQKEPVIHIYMAQSHYKLEAYKHAIKAFEVASPMLYSKPQYLAMYIECHWKSRQQEKAFDILQEAAVTFPKFAHFHKQSFYYLTQMKLFKEAFISGKKFIDLTRKKQKAYLVVGSILGQNKEYQSAIQILQEAKLAFPKNSDIAVMLAHLYIKTHQVQAAADLFDQASILDSKYIKEASELYRRAKKLYRALYFNTQIKDQKEKYKQRIAILLEFSDFEMIAAMEKTLKRVDLIKDEDIRYALAFTLFQTGQYQKSEEHLSLLMRADNFKKSIELRKMIDNCKKSPWKCN